MPDKVVLVEMKSPPAIEEALDALAGDDRPFLLESALRMPEMGRYTILGSAPFLTLSAKGDCIVEESGKDRQSERGNPFARLRSVLKRHRVASCEGIPFIGGGVGYLGYDLCHFVERLPRAAVDDIPLPDLHFAFYDTAAVIDHERGRAWAAAADLGLAGRPSARARAGELIEKLTRPAATARSAKGPTPEMRCNFTREAYLAAIQRAKDYIAAGDIFQVNLSRRFETTLPVAPVELYRRLRRVNPAPMAAYLGLDGGAVVSASPERFLRVRGRHVQTRPIKGTRPRGRTPAEDAALAEELLRSEKDGAELAMIVDLERNDLGRVCSYGTVRVTEARVLESYPTVHHLVATVEGELHSGHDLVDLLRASFPGGSITGAPKVRAMEIIAELEPTCRSVYTGAMGYIGFDGSMDLNIVIRTFIAHGDRLWFQVGGGIVADSDLAAEYDETYHKARALIQAVLQ